MDQVLRIQKEQQHLLLQVIQRCMRNGIQLLLITQMALHKRLQQRWYLRVRLQRLLH